MTRALSRRRDVRKAGFTLVELSIGVVILSVLLLAVNHTFTTGQKASSATTSSMDLSDSLRVTLRRLSEDLRSAGRKAEDTNDNGVLDVGEDSNGNGRFEHDWAVTTSSITFNRLRSDGTYALPVTYRLNGVVLERVVTMDASGKQIVTVLARSVSEFTVTESGPKVRVLIGLTRSSVGGATQSRTQAVTILPRN